MEWSSLISWTNHSPVHLCLECRAGMLPTAILATESAGKGKTPTQQAPFVSLEKCRSLSRICPQQLKGTSAEKWYYYKCQWVAVLLFYYNAVYLMHQKNYFEQSSSKTGKKNLCDSEHLKWNPADFKGLEIRKTP